MLTTPKTNTQLIKSGAGKEIRETTHYQELFPDTVSCSKESLTSLLNKGSIFTVKVIFTRNRVSMLSITSGRFGGTTIRMHEKFLEADIEIHRALKRYIKSHRKADWKIVAEYARQIFEKDENRTTPLQKTHGHCYDLKEILQKVNIDFFNGQMKCKITWGQAKAIRGRRRSIRYGSYMRTQNLIRIHPALDRPDVPRTFVEYIVFHEMLHAAVPSFKVNGRNYDHGPAFRKLEHTFPNLKEMRKLSKDLLAIV